MNRTVPRRNGARTETRPALRRRWLPARRRIECASTPSGRERLREAYACPGKRSRDVADVGEVDHKRCAVAGLARDVDVATGLRDDAMHDGEAEAAALPKLF